MLGLTAEPRIFTAYSPETAGGPKSLVAGDVFREIIGAFFDVYNDVGCRFVESVYQRAMPVALKERGVNVEREVPLRVMFRGETVGDFRADLIVEGRVLVEITAAEKLIHVHELQLINYLRATGLRVGLLLNCGPRATFRRLMG